MKKNTLKKTEEISVFEVETHNKTLIQNENIETNNSNNWKVYILLSNDGSLYTGITNNMPLRWKKHKEKKGAKYFYSRRPIALNYLEGQHTRSSASKREYEIKKLNHRQKWQLIFRYFGPFST